MARPTHRLRPLPPPSKTHVFVKKGAGSGTEHRPFNQSSPRYKFTIRKSGLLWMWSVDIIDGARVWGVFGSAFTKKGAVRRAQKAAEKVLERRAKIQTSTRRYVQW